MNKQVVQGLTRQLVGPAFLYVLMSVKVIGRRGVFAYEQLKNLSHIPRILV